MVFPHIIIGSEINIRIYLVQILNTILYTRLEALTTRIHITIIIWLHWVSSLNFCTQDGKTAIHLAAQEGKVDVVRLLNEAGAQLNIETKVQYCYSCMCHTTPCSSTSSLEDQALSSHMLCSHMCFHLHIHILRWHIKAMCICMCVYSWAIGTVAACAAMVVLHFYQD